MNSAGQRLRDGSARVGVVGLGYVGLPLVVELCAAGYEVHGIDVDSRKIESLLVGKSYITDVNDEELAPIIESGQFIPTTDFAVAGQLDAISVCVPTPLRKTKDPDISFVKSATEAVAKHLTADTLIVLESTTYPGTTEELMLPLLEGAGFKVGKDLFLAYSPERVDPGNPTYQTRNTPKVIGGVTPTCTEFAQAYYSGVVDTIHAVGSAREAEMVKLLENTFRAVNIALVNEMLLMCDRMDIDIWRVVEAAATKPFGFMPFYPGPGIGGHCIPIDPMYLSWKAKTYDFFNRFIELATDINGNMPRFVVTKLMNSLNDREQHLRGSKILIIGMAYKPGVTDTRESPGIELFSILGEKGALVDYHDPLVSELTIAGSNYESVELTPENIASFDCVLLATAQPGIDLNSLVENASLLFDTRNVLKEFDSDHVVKL